MSKKWRRRVRRIDHVAAKVGAVVVNVIPGVGQVLSVAAGAAIAANEKAAAARHAANKRADIQRANAAAIASQEAQMIAPMTQSDAGSFLSTAVAPGVRSPSMNAGMIPSSGNSSSFLIVAALVALLLAKKLG